MKLTEERRKIKEKEMIRNKTNIFSLLKVSQLTVMKGLLVISNNKAKNKYSLTTEIQFSLALLNSNI